MYRNVLHFSAIARLWVTSLTLAVVLTIPSSCSRHAAPVGKVRIAVPAFQSSALVLLARQQRFFEQEGLEATFEFRPTGRDCLELALKGDADFAVVYETPVVHASLAGEPIAILTELHRSEGNTAVVVRRHRGITGTSSLVGKRISVTPKTNAEFLLDLYLRSHLVEPRSTRIIKMPINDSVAAIRSGEVDAAALWEPYVSTVISADPSNFERLRSSFYSEFSVLAARSDSLVRLAPAASAVLRALARAEAFFLSDEDRATRIVDDVLREKNVTISQEAWKQIDIHIGLSATLLAMLSEEARWYRMDGGAIRIDMRPLLQKRFLTEVAPDRVTFE